MRCHWRVHMCVLTQGPEHAIVGHRRCCHEGVHSLLSVDEPPHDVVAPHVCVLMRDFKLFNGVGKQLLEVLEIVLGEDAGLGDATIQRVQHPASHQGRCMQETSSTDWLASGPTVSA